MADFTTPQLRTGKEQNTTVTDAGVQLVVGAGSGSQVSRVLDADQMVDWDRLTYQASVPAGATLRLYVRTGSTTKPDGTWSGWTSVAQNARVVAHSRYLQYRVVLTRGYNGATPILSGVSITSDAKPTTPAGEE